MDSVGKPVFERSYRDRRGRGIRGSMIPKTVPGYRTPAQRFDDLVVELSNNFENRIGTKFGNVEVAVEDIPPSDPAPWEEYKVTLARHFPSVLGSPNRIVLYRKPIEARVTSYYELRLYLYEIIAEQISYLLDIDLD